MEKQQEQTTVTNEIYKDGNTRVIVQGDYMLIMEFDPRTLTVKPKVIK